MPRSVLFCVQRCIAFGRRALCLTGPASKRLKPNGHTPTETASPRKAAETRRYSRDSVASTVRHQYPAERSARITGKGLPSGHPELRRHERNRVVRRPTGIEDTGEVEADDASNS
jgi:hypothetical protein